MMKKDDSRQLDGWHYYGFTEKVSSKIAQLSWPQSRIIQADSVSRLEYYL